ncbi:hypothetical protein BDV11DRAFT_169055 [Aspergillus similis]
MPTSVSPEEAQDGIRSQSIVKNGQVLITWRPVEVARIVRKLDFLFRPIFALMFTWMAIDRTNVSGVLTPTFLDDTSMNHDQANTASVCSGSGLSCWKSRLTSLSTAWASTTGFPVNLSLSLVRLSSRRASSAHSTTSEASWTEGVESRQTLA